MFHFINAILSWFQTEDTQIVKNENYNADELGDIYIQPEMFDDLFN